MLPASALYGHPVNMDTFYGPLSVQINGIWLYCNLNKWLTCTQNNVRIMSYNIIFPKTKLEV